MTGFHMYYFQRLLVTVGLSAEKLSVELAPTVHTG